MLSENSRDFYFIKRCDFQAKILKEIYDNYYKLLEYNTHRPSTSAAPDRNSIAIFYILLTNRSGHSIDVSENIYECHCGHGQKGMSFQGHEFFRTVRQLL